MELDLSGRTAVITGAGRGIGRAIAHTFAAAGADVVAAARTEAEIEAVADAVAEEHGVESLAVPTDLRDLGDIEALIERTVEAFGRSEVLVNNAAQNLTNPPEEQTVDEVREMGAVNLEAVFFLTRRWATQFRSAGASAGRVINIASNSALFGVPAMTYYGATNAGVRAMTRAFAVHLADEGVTVNSVTPGLTRTDRIDDLLERQDRGEIDRIHRLEEHPLGRPGEPDEVAFACLCLADDRAGYINGTDVLVDGGLEATSRMYET